MTRILLLSDTHGYMDEAILKHVAEADEVWHAGDFGTMEVADRIRQLKPLRAVYGNIDDHRIRAEFPLHNRFESEGVKVWITHIGGYPGRYDRRIRTAIATDPPDLFICGHSHILKVMRDEKHNLLHMNPGAIGKHGFHRKRTMLKFVLQGAEVRDLQLVEYPR